MDPTNKFGELTFLQLTGKNGVPLPPNPFIVGKSIETCAGGPIEGAKTEAQGTKYLLKVRNPSQVVKLLKLTKLIDGTDVEIVPHPTLNVSRCIISSFDLIRMNEEEILSELSGGKVIRVQRITRNEGGKRVNTSALILTFCTTTYPEFIKVGVLHIPTRPYFPNPMLCYSCFSYGHTRARCPGPQRCYNCSGDFHGEEECGNASLCLNCKGDHRPTSRQCPVYKKEVEIIKIKVSDNVSFPEARKRVEQRTGDSFAQVVAQQNAFEEKLKELEAAMTRKDAEINRLQEENKRKDKKIAQMMTYIQQLKQQATTQEKQHHVREQTSSQEKPQHSKETRPTTTGPVTRSRNNSPVVHETKRGRPPKYNFAKPASPERLSPPPKTKKTALTTHDLTQMEYSGDESEISETNHNHRLR
jgi:hypothetical protein